MSSALEPRAGMAVAGVVLGGFAIAGAVALVTAPITPHRNWVRSATDLSAPTIAGQRATASPLSRLD